MDIISNPGWVQQAQKVWESKTNLSTELDALADTILDNPSGNMNFQDDNIGLFTKAEVLSKYKRMRVFMSLKAMGANIKAQLSKALYCNGRSQYSVVFGALVG